MPGMHGMMRKMGRFGDTELGHLTPGEVVVPPQVAGPLMPALQRGFAEAGAPMGRYIVGGDDDSINPMTGAREYFFDGGGTDHAGAGDGGGFGGGGADSSNGGSYGGSTRSAGHSSRAGAPSGWSGISRGGGGLPSSFDSFIGVPSSSRMFSGAGRGLLGQGGFAMSRNSRDAAGPLASLGASIFGFTMPGRLAKAFGLWDGQPQHPDLAGIRGPREANVSEGEGTPWWMRTRPGMTAPVQAPREPFPTGGMYGGFGGGNRGYGQFMPDASGRLQGSGRMEDVLAGGGRGPAMAFPAREAPPPQWFPTPQPRPSYGMNRPYGSILPF